MGKMKAPHKGVVGLNKDGQVVTFVPFSRANRYRFSRYRGKATLCRVCGMEIRARDEVIQVEGLGPVCRGVGLSGDLWTHVRSANGERLAYRDRGVPCPDNYGHRRSLPRRVVVAGDW